MTTFGRGIRFNNGQDTGDQDQVVEKKAPVRYIDGFDDTFEMTGGVEATPDSVWDFIKTRGDTARMWLPDGSPELGRWAANLASVGWSLEKQNDQIYLFITNDSERSFEGALFIEGDVKSFVTMNWDANRIYKVFTM